MNQLNSYSQFSLEPIYSPDGIVFFYELLSKITEPENYLAGTEKITSFSFLTFEEKLSIFVAQLHIAIDVTTQSDVYPIIPLNVDMGLIEYILSDLYILTSLQKSSEIRLKTCENFDFPAHLALLKKLAEYCPLWLGEFGTGYASLTIATINQFDYIKIDKKFFWQFGSGNAFRDFIAHIRLYCHGIIVKVIENELYKK